MNTFKIASSLFTLWLFTACTNFGAKNETSVFPRRPAQDSLEKFNIQKRVIIGGGFINEDSDNEGAPLSIEKVDSKFVLKSNGKPDTLNSFLLLKVSGRFFGQCGVSDLATLVERVQSNDVKTPDSAFTLRFVRLTAANSIGIDLQDLPCIGGDHKDFMVNLKIAPDGWGTYPVRKWIYSMPLKDSNTSRRLLVELSTEKGWSFNVESSN